MAMNFHVEVRKENLERIIDQLPEVAHEIVAKTAFDIEAGAKERARVDTGAMKGGLKASEETPLVYHVTGHADHTIYNERGTRYMSAQPMLRPAAFEAEPKFIAAFKALERRLG